MKVYIITGTSRGIGEAMASQLLQQGYQLCCFSRNPNPALLELAEKEEGDVHYIQQDLRDWKVAKSKLETYLKKLNPSNLKELTLIHNAGQLKPIKLLGEGREGETIFEHILINQFVPEVLTESLLSICKDWEISKKILLISSGAGRKPVPAWSTYCMTKAAIDMFARCIKAEQESKAWPFRVVSLAPGVVETNMQQHIREQSLETFPGVGRFLKLKSDNALWPTSQAAKHLLAYLASDTFGEKEVDDIRHWLQEQSN